MNQMTYKPIVTIKESNKATVMLALLDGYGDPVIVKRLKGVASDVYTRLSQVESPHLPKIYSWEIQENELVVAEEYVDGETLKHYLEQGKLPEEQKISLALQLCEAVEVLHGCTPPIIHRDIKPSNILLSEDGVLKLIDFDASRQYKLESNTSDTRILGTVEYAAPEQYGYMQTDVRSDIYSMGVVMNGLEFKGNPAAAGLWKRMVDKCTSFDPRNRYKTVKDVERDIRRVQIVQHNFGKLLCGMLCVVLLLCGGISLGMQARQTTGENTVQGTSSTTLNGTLSPSEAENPTVLPDISPTVPVSEKPESSPVVSEEPTPGITPVVSEEPTPGITPVVSEEPSLQLTAAAEPVPQHSANLSDGDIVAIHVPWDEEGREFLYYTSFFEMVSEITEVTLRKEPGENAVPIPEESYYLKNSILHINRTYLQGFDSGLYEMLVRYEMKAGFPSEGMSVYLRLYQKGEEAEKAAKYLAGNYLDYWYGEHETLHAVLWPNAATVITGLVLEEEQVSEEQYRILYQGQALELPAALLEQCKNQPETVFYIQFEDGSKEALVIANPYMRHYME